jgi:hypothetical protein
VTNNDLRAILWLLEHQGKPFTLFGHPVDLLMYWDVPEKEKAGFIELMKTAVEKEES